MSIVLNKKLRHIPIYKDGKIYKIDSLGQSIMFYLINNGSIKKSDKP